MALTLVGVVAVEEEVEEVEKEEERDAAGEK